MESSLTLVFALIPPNVAGAVGLLMVRCFFGSGVHDLSCTRCLYSIHTSPIGLQSRVIQGYVPTAGPLSIVDIIINDQRTYRPHVHLKFALSSRTVLGDRGHAVSQVNGPTGLTILSDVFARSDAIQPRSAVVSRSLVTRLENPHRYLIRCYSDHYILAAVADLCDCQGPEDPV